MFALAGGRSCATARPGDRSTTRKTRSSPSEPLWTTRSSSARNSPDIPPRSTAHTRGLDPWSRRVLAVYTRRVRMTTGVDMIILTGVLLLAAGVSLMVHTTRRPGRHRAQPEYLKLRPAHARPRSTRRPGTLNPPALIV